MQHELTSTNKDEMQIVSVQLRFSHTVAKKLLDDQGEDFSEILASL